MGLFSKARGRGAEAAVAQVRSAETHPFGMLSDYVPLGGGEAALYRAIREAVPIIDAAIIKLIRLTGGFRVRCEDERIEMRLGKFLRNVNAGRGQRGISAFLDSYLDSMITCGSGVGEIITRGNREIVAVICANISDVRIREGRTPLDFKICGRTEKGAFEELPYQELLLFTPYNPEASHPYGVSLLRSLPFLADILLKIFNSIGVNWERAGNVRFAVVYKPQGDMLDRAYARERSEQIAREWSAAMQSGKNGAVRDFIAVGDVDIRVIGADNQILDSEAPVRQILEQIVARTGIPPFMLGLNWSSTERMSVQQADLMTSEITAVRRTLNPIIERICDMWLRMNGYACGYEIVWDDINLHDRIEEARSGLYQAQAENIRENLRGGGERIEPLGGDVISGAEMVPENEKGKGDDLG